MTCTFTDPVGLSGCIRLAIYHAWGTTMEKAHPHFKRTTAAALRPDHLVHQPTRERRRHGLGVAH
jgi:hypothetical protein